MRELYANNAGLMRQLTAEFGDEILHPNGTLNRKLLGSQVFRDPHALAALDRIVHPHLLLAIRERMFSALRVMNRVVLDAALIVEWGMRPELDCLVLITAPESLRRQRLMSRDGLSQEEAAARIRSQMPEAGKRPFADFEIVNDVSGEDLVQKADAAWRAIETRFGG
jgi:dephospho-CoA kinase